MSKKMGFWGICYGVFAICLLIGMVVFIYLESRGIITENTLNTWQVVLEILLFVPIFLWVGKIVFWYFKTSLNNVRSCGDKLFDEIKIYSRHCGETKEHYQDMIQVINFYYKEGGKVDTVVGTDLKRLYNRLEFLKQEVQTEDHLNTCIISVGLSVCASVYFDMVSSESVMRLWFIVMFAFLFLGVVLFKYFKIIHESDSQISEYEIKLLTDKITAAENSILDDIQSEDILKTKRNVLNELIDRYGFATGKKRENIEKDIRVIEKLNLNLRDLYSYKELLFSIGKKKREIKLYIDENNKWPNEQYETLYVILRKYNLICEVELDEQ